MNPTDGALAQFVGQSREQGEMSRKQKRRELKKQREKQGDVASADFKGPWATYAGMEKFIAQEADMTAEQ